MSAGPCRPRREWRVLGAFRNEIVQSVRRWTDELFSFRTTRDRGFRFTSGQFAMIGIRIEGKPLLRACSIASAHYDDELEFFSIKVPDGQLTSRLKDLAPGDEVLVGAKATGTLPLDSLMPGRNLYLPGTGLAPFLSIVRDPEVYERRCPANPRWKRPSWTDRGGARLRRPPRPAPTGSARVIASGAPCRARPPFHGPVGERGFMSVGLVALFDDVATLAKAAAASIDDVAGQAARAGTKAAGVVIDDTAVTPRYVVGFRPSRELPIIGKIALGSLRNKLLILLPAALAFSFLLPEAITPLLMLGGAYLCYEGAEKVYGLVFPHGAEKHEARLETVAIDARTFEDEKVASAIKTDFILSAEIMAITLASLPEGSLLTRAIILAVVGAGITAGVYGVVAVIVKADDAGLALAGVAPDSALAAPLRLIGRGLVRGMPWLLRALGVVGTAAMIWVGGGIIVHGLESFGLEAPAHALHEAGVAAAGAVPAAGRFVAWLVEAAGAGVIGLAIGLLAIPLASHVLSPLWRPIKARIRRLLNRTP